MARIPQLMRSIRNRPEIPVISQPRDLEAKLRGSCRSSTRDLKSRDDMNQIHQRSGQRPSRPRTTCTQILPMIEVGCNTVDRLSPGDDHMWIGKNTSRGTVSAYSILATIGVHRGPDWVTCGHQAQRPSCPLCPRQQTK